MKNFLKATLYNTLVPVYYPLFMFPLRRWRSKSISMLSFNSGDKIIVPGVGTGHDLPYLPRDVKITGVDISRVMLSIGRFKAKAYKLTDSVSLQHMDAEKLDFPDNSFDKAVLSLFLTASFNAKKTFAEVVRVLKPNSEILIYDHLIRRGSLPKFLYKPLDMILSFGFASVTKVLEDIIEGQPVSLVKVINGDPVGFLRGYLLIKD